MSSKTTTTKKAASSPKTSSTPRTSSTKKSISSTRASTSSKPPPSTSRLPSSTSSPSSSSTESPSGSSSLPESTSSIFEEPTPSPPIFPLPPSSFPSPSSSSSPLSSSSSSLTSFSSAPQPGSTPPPTSEPSAIPISSSPPGADVDGMTGTSEVKKVPVSTVAGSAAGGFVLVVAVIISIIFCRRRRRARRTSSRISVHDAKHPFFAMQSLAPSTSEFTPVPYSLNAAISPTRSGEQKERASMQHYPLSPPPPLFADSDRGSSSGSSVELGSENGLATGTLGTSRLSIPYRDNFPPSPLRSTPTSTSGPSEKGIGGATSSHSSSNGRERGVSGMSSAMRGVEPHVFMHEDSGVRVVVREQGVIEIPPAYTPR